MPTLSDERPKGNSKTAKQKTPAPAEVILYYANQTEPYSEEAYKPVNLTDLYNVLWDIIHMVDGVTDIIDTITEPPVSDGVSGPLSVARLACKRINNTAFSLVPENTVNGQQIKRDKYRSGGVDRGWVYSLKVEDTTDPAEEVSQ